MPTALPPLPGDTRASAEDIGPSGVIVGVSRGSDGSGTTSTAVPWLPARD